MYSRSTGLWDLLVHGKTHLSSMSASDKSCWIHTMNQ